MKILMDLLERHLPKGTDFNKINAKTLQITQEKLNNRPRQIIGYKTPKEIMNYELKSVAWIH